MFFFQLFYFSFPNTLHVETNISHESEETLHGAASILAYLTESTIFLNLGIYGAKVLQSHFVAALPLAAWTILFCTVVRFCLVYGITWILNNVYRTRKICYQNQFIMAYGGLRGGIAFSLMMLADLGEHNDQKELLMCATLMLILFTCFLQGTTIEYFVNKFHVEKQEDNKPVSVEFHNEVIEEVMMGMKAIADRQGREYYYNRWEQWKTKHLNPIFENRPEHLQSVLHNLAGVKSCFLKLSEELEWRNNDI